MTLVPLQAPWPAPQTRVERPTPSAHALPPQQTVAAVPDQPAKGLSTGMPGFRDRLRDTFEQERAMGFPAAAKEDVGPQPFPELRFADPLPSLPELDLPGKNSAYQAALHVLRQPDAS